MWPEIKMMLFSGERAHTHTPDILPRRSTKSEKGQMEKQFSFSGRAGDGGSVMKIIMVWDSEWSVTRVSLRAVFNHGDGQLTGCLAATAAFGYMVVGVD